jgi:hypothetical protein
MSRENIKFLFMTDGLPLQIFLTIPKIDSDMFTDWLRHILSEVHKQYGMTLEAQDIPKLKYRMDPDDEAGTAVKDDATSIPVCSFTVFTILTARLPKNKFLPLFGTKRLTSLFSSKPEEDAAHQVALAL